MSIRIRCCTFEHWILWSEKDAIRIGHGGSFCISRWFWIKNKLLWSRYSCSEWQFLPSSIGYAGGRLNVGELGVCGIEPDEESWIGRVPIVIGILRTGFLWQRPNVALIYDLFFQNEMFTKITKLKKNEMFNYLKIICDLNHTTWCRICRWNWWDIQICSNNFVWIFTTALRFFCYY